MFTWESFVKHVAQAPTDYPHLRTAIVAQAALESGWGTSNLFTKYGNPFGMHYHDFLKDLGKGVTYDACDGKSIYACFESPETALKAYWRWFEHWSHYGDWKSAANKTALDWLKHIGPKYCPPGFTDPWKATHEGYDYAEYIIHELYPKAEQQISQFYTPNPVPEDVVTWFRIHMLDSAFGVAAMDGNNIAHATWRGKDIQSMIEFVSRFKKARTMVPADGAAWPGVINPPKNDDEPKPIPTKPTGKRVLLDPGHSEGNVGARGKTADVQEEDFNRLQATILKAELAELGISADIYDPHNDDRSAIGRKAQGYDAFVSLHLNAAGKKEYYTCAMCSPRVQSPNSKSAKVASAWAQSCAAAIGNKCFSGSPGWPVGVMAVGLTVLSAAAQTDCPIFFLSEMEFIDDESTETISRLKADIAKGMKAGARVLADALKN